MSSSRIGVFGRVQPPGLPRFNEAAMSSSRIVVCRCNCWAKLPRFNEAAMSSSRIAAGERALAGEQVLLQ